MVPGGERGQAASEYVALIALAAVVLALAAGLTSGGIGRGVLAGMQRGLCLVSAGPCPRPLPPGPDLAPCPVARSERTEELSETIASVRLAARGTLSLERASDGRVTVTLAKGNTVGGELGVGLRLGSAGGAVRAGGGATWTSGRAWRLSDAAAARRFVEAYGAKATIGGWLVDQLRSRCSLLCDAIGWRPHAQLPEPDETFVEGGPFATLAATFGVEGVAAEGELGAGTVLGRRIARDGATTWYLRLDAGSAGDLGLPVAELSGRLAADGVLAYELDARGRPRTLGVQLAGGGAGGLALGGRPAGARGELLELEATLDLRERRNRAAAGALLAALRDVRALGALPGSVRALGARIAHAGQLDLRRYALSGAGGERGVLLGLGVELGGGLAHATRGLRLVSAETRLPGLPFLPRDDCRPA